jgi:hypothetical protein
MENYKILDNILVYEVCLVFCNKHLAYLAGVSPHFDFVKLHSRVYMGLEEPGILTASVGDPDPDTLVRGVDPAPDPDPFLFS